MAERVDLEQLRERLAKLGVHIDAPQSRSLVSSPDQRAKQKGCQVADTAWETHLERNSKEVAQLLERCNKVHQALHMSDGSDEDAGSDDEHAAKRTDTSRAAAATRAAAAAVKAAAAAVGSSKTAAAAPGAGKLSKPAASRSTAGASSSKSKAAAAVAAAGSAAAAAAGPAAKAAAADADSSKLLVRAAQRLLRNAQAEAQQVDRTLSTAAPQQQQQQQQQLVAAGRPGAAAADQQHRGTPLGTVLAQYKEAQAAWAQEKAKLRREAVASRKKASKLELELARVTRAQQHAALDVSTLKAALKGRDIALSEAQQRCKDLEETLAKSQEVAAEKLCSLARERDDLQALLLATLQRLEGVEVVVAAADATSAAMEDKVRVLEAERAAALDAAAAARAEVQELQEAQRRLTWQSQLLEKMSEVQLRHNKRKSAAIKELLTSAAAGEPCGKAAAAAEGRNRAGGKHRSPGGPSAVLQGVLDELLEAGGDDEEYEGDSCFDADGPAGGRRGMHGDVSTVLSDEGDEAASLLLP